MEYNKELEQLLVKYFNNQCTEAEFEKVAEIFRESAHDKDLPEIFDRALKKVESDLEIRKSHSRKIWNEIKQDIKPPDEQSNIKKFFTYPIVRLAASLLLMMVVLYIFVNKNGPVSTLEKAAVEYRTVESPLGKKNKLVFPDGSIAYMNSGTKITYPTVFSDETRKIKLSGEAFFEITKNEKKPFIIDADHVSTKVVGTSFNISSYEEEPFEITLVTGKVEVSAIQKEHKTVTLIPNQQAIYDVGMGEFNTRKVDIRSYMAWKEGTLTLKGNLSSISKKIERWYNKKVIIKNQQLEKCMIDAKYENEYLDNVLQGLSYLIDMEYKINGDTVILRGNGCSKNMFN